MVQVGPGRDGEFAVRVLDSPAGQGKGSFRLPWNPGEWGRIRGGLVRGNRDLAAGKLSANLLTPQQIGDELFRALFSDQVGLLWARSLGAVQDGGLRIQLRFKLDEEPAGSSLLHSLPWELLRQPDTRDFLALSRQTPVVRYLKVPRPVSVSLRPPILRILVVLSSPAGLPPLDVAREQREIQEAWGGRPEVVVDCLERPRTEALREALRLRPYHVLHFMGHGKLDSSTGEGLLFFEDRDGKIDPVSGEALATLLKDVKSLRMVFLNACDTARVEEETGLDPFAGVATALVMAGLPAAVAMQLSISDSAAITFSQAVHLRLAEGDPVDAAVTEGRKALFAAHHFTTEWAVPVLFTRVADGRIFEREEQLDPGARPAPSSRPRRHRLRTGLAAGLGLAVLLAVTLVIRSRAALPWPVKIPVLESVQVGSFRIGRFEVTESEFLQFIRANPQWRRDRIERGLHDRDYLKHWISWQEFPPKLDDHPVTRVSWYAADAFCDWVGGRLPQQGEWQAAAHTAEHRFPWGPKPPAGPLLNFCASECLRDFRDPVRSDGFLDPPRSGPSRPAPPAKES